MARIVLAWGMWGPYHGPRFEALKRLAESRGHAVTGLSLFSASSINGWGVQRVPDGVQHVTLGSDEAQFPFRRAGSLISLLRRLKPDVILVPSYWHWSLVLNLASRLLRARVVMMNDSHAGTAKARGLALLGKRRIVSSFDAALVGGEPQKRYFMALGLRPNTIYTGYDAVDNDYFARRASEIRASRAETRNRYALPRHYFLSLGRLVPKKNLDTLIRAYALYVRASPTKRTHLVMVGSGTEEPKLLRLCAELGLPTCEQTKSDCVQPRGDRMPLVHFYGFRHIEESPIFYALADAFVLPSLQEEWGLVVNEAMASGLPVAVSETAGCVEDLLPKGRPKIAAPHDWTTIERFGLASRTRKNGFVFDPLSAGELSRVLLVFESSAELRAAMGAASRRIVERFSCENFADNALRAVETAMAR